MKELDGRKLSHEALEEIRMRAVRAVEAGESPETVIRSLGMTRPRIYVWLAAYREGGIEALKAKKLFGRPPKLNDKALKALYNIVTTKNPQQLRFEFALWTRGIIRDLVQERFNVKLSVVSVGRLLKKLGLSPQRPLARAYQRNPEEVQKWLQEQYPAIQRLAKQTGAQIYFGDEAGIRSDYHSGTTWAPGGKTPVVDRTGARFSLNLLSAISPRGELRFMCWKGTLTAGVFVDFLRRLIDRAQSPIFLIVDRHPVHRASEVRKFVAATEGRLRLFYLPSYAPDLNPDELVGSHLKHHRVGRFAIKGPDHLKRKVIGCLRSLQKHPHLVRNLFLAPSVRYAADMSSYLRTS
jgi:transposase